MENKFIEKIRHLYDQFITDAQRSNTYITIPANKIYVPVKVAISFKYFVVSNIGKFTRLPYRIDAGNCVILRLNLFCVSTYRMWVRQVSSPPNSKQITAS